MLDAGAKVNSKNRKGISAAFFAAAGGEHFLVASKLGQNVSAEWCLHSAIRLLPATSCSCCVPWTNISACTPEGKADLSVSAGHKELLEFLAKRKANLTGTNKAGKTLPELCKTPQMRQLAERLVGASRQCGCTITEVCTACCDMHRSSRAQSDSCSSWLDCF